MDVCLYERAVRSSDGLTADGDSSAGSSFKGLP